MPAPSWTQTVDDIFTTTWMYRKEEAVEQAYLRTPFIFWLKDRGRVKQISGHRRIEVPVEYGDNETVKWMTKGDTISLTESELVTMAYEEWKYVAVNINRYFQDDQQNRGAGRMINFVELKLNAAERALYEDMERVVFADGTGGNEPNGLKNLVAAAPSTGTVHGLNRATYTWWRNQQKTATGAASVYLISDMRNCLNNILKYSRAEVKEIVMVTDQTTYELYEQEGYDIYQLTNNHLYDAGFDVLNYRGRPIMWCPSAPSGYMYFLNTSYINMVIDPGYWMDMTEWKAIPNQPNDRVAQIVCTMQMIVTRPICQLVLTGIAA